MNPTLDLFSVSSDMLSLHLGSFLCVTCSECSSVVLAPGARLFGRRGFSLHLSKLGMSSGWRRGRGLPPALPSNLPQEGQAVSPLFLSRWQGLGRGRAQLPAVLRVSPVSPKLTPRRQVTWIAVSSSMSVSLCFFSFLTPLHSWKRRIPCIHLFTQQPGLGLLLGAAGFQRFSGAGHSAVPHPPKSAPLEARAAPSTGEVASHLSSARHRQGPLASLLKVLPDKAGLHQHLTITYVTATSEHLQKSCWEKFC